MTDARQPFRDGETCVCVAASLPWVELDMMVKGIIKGSVDIYQLGYRTGVAASAGTHAKGGCTDVGQYSAKAIDTWRLWGWTMQDRSPFFDEDHGHGWPYRCPHLAEPAQDQQRAWDSRRNGLVNNQPVIGRWPVQPWKTALAKERPRVLNEIADAVLSRDGQIANMWKDRDPKAGDFVALRTAVKHLAEDQRDIKKRLDLILDQVQKV